MAHVEVAPRAPDEARARGPAAPAQHLLEPEVRHGIFAVRIAYEPGIGVERIVHPLPDVADHLAAAHRAVTLRQGANVDRPARAEIEAGARRRRHVVTPGEPALDAAHR